MNVLEAIVLGLVEGVTEYLPVSSTGHLILAEALLGLAREGDRAPVDAFLIVVQGGAILAVLGLYRKRVAAMIAGLLGGDRAGLRLAGHLLVAFAPAAVLGPLLGDAIEERLFHPVPVIAALAAGGVLMIAIAPFQGRLERGLEIEDLTWRAALFIGLMQCAAMWPGTSRSMVTIVAASVAGLRGRAAAEFSFLLALPTLGGAAAWRLVKSFASDEQSMLTAFGWLPLLAGLAAATISAALAVKWLVAWLSRHDLAVFGWYRLGIAALFAALVWRGFVFA